MNVDVTQWEAFTAKKYDVAAEDVFGWIEKNQDGEAIRAIIRTDDTTYDVSDLDPSDFKAQREAREKQTRELQAGWAKL